MVDYMLADEAWNKLDNLLSNVCNKIAEHDASPD